MILLTNDEMIDIVTFPIESDFKLCKAQVKKVAEWLLGLPADGWDNWHFYHKDLA